MPSGCEVVLHVLIDFMYPALGRNCTQAQCQASLPPEFGIKDCVSDTMLCMSLISSQVQVAGAPTRYCSLVSNVTAQEPYIGIFDGLSPNPCNHIQQKATSAACVFAGDRLRQQCEAGAAAS